MNLLVVETGHVGMSMAFLLSQNHDVVAIEINVTKVEFINQKKPPIEDDPIHRLLQF